MMNSNFGKEEKRNKLKIAIAKQTKVTKENIFGEGVDVPLLGKYKAMHTGSNFFLIAVARAISNSSKNHIQARLWLSKLGVDTSIGWA